MPTRIILYGRIDILNNELLVRCVVPAFYWFSVYMSLLQKRDAKIRTIIKVTGFSEAVRACVSG